MHGFNVARRIRAQPRFASTTLIAMTGWGQQGDRDRSGAAGIDHHLTKPPDLPALQALLMSLNADRLRGAAQQ